MQLVLIIAIGLAALASDDVVRASLASLHIASTSVAVFVACATPLCTALCMAMLVRKTIRALDHGRASAFQHAVRWRDAAPWIGLGATAFVLYGTPLALALPEHPSLRWILPVIAVGIPLCVAIGVLATWYPLERRMYEATIVRQLDEGLALQPFLTRTAYVAARLRLTVVLTLAPIGIPMCIGAIVAEVMERIEPGSGRGSMDIATLSSAVLLFMAAPLLVRGALGLRVLEPGALRARLDQLASDAGAPIRAIYVWPTGGLVANAMVLGVIPGTRAVILTDRLIERLRDDELDAVMAHELGHVRRRHLLWFIVVIIAAFTFGGLIMEPLWPLFGAVQVESAFDATRILLSAGGAFAVGLWIFGWASRRFERQADAFAVQLLSGRTGAVAATPQAISSVVQALLGVCRSTGASPSRHSWRHGSIASRVDALEAMEGVELSRFPIDRTVRAIKLASLVVALAGLLAP